MSKYTLHKSVLKHIDTLKSEELKTAVKDFINYTPIDFVVIESGGLRTAELQNALFKKGYSQLDGYKYKSAHQSGLAVDIVPWVNNEPSWDIKHCTGLACAFASYLNLKGIKFVGGYDWNNDGILNESFYDPCHFEVES
jgi:peptidoglycan L-alanyl-D-glutamate endopeptidase CwlK